MRKLFLFTKKFPYGKAEAFLEAEIEILSRWFDKVIIYPAYTEKFIRKIPDNCHVDETYNVRIPERRLRCIEVILNGTYFRYVIDHITKVKKIEDFINLLRYACYERYYEKIFLLNRNNFDNTLVYSYWFSYIVNSLLHIRNKYNIKFKIISRAHRWDIYEEDSPLFPYRQSNIKDLDFLYSISEDGRNYLINRYNNEHKIKVSRLGVFQQDKITDQTGPQNLHILSVAQVNNRKRIIELFDLIYLYAQKHKKVEIRWTHFGVGELYETLKKHVERNNLLNFEIDLKGYVLNQYIYEFYKTEPVDVFVNISRSEGVPVSIMEAQSFGLPVIATDVGGTREIINKNIGVLLKVNFQKGDFFEALNMIIQKRFNQKIVLKSWSEKSDAAKNFAAFASEITSM